ncbi:MAG: glycosyltransferase [Porphyromonadaceae bacterium]|nr:glycosyltransferase [Porphyromonadaceae bacterium]
MNTLIKRVGFLHHDLHLGGGERVSYDTASLFASWGIHSVFIAQTHVPEEFMPPSGDLNDVLLIPKSYKKFDSAYTKLLIEYINARQIDILFVCGAQPELPHEVRERTGCRLVFWSHVQPFWEYTCLVERKKRRGRTSILKWLEWQTIGRLKYQVLSNFREDNRRSNLNHIKFYDRFIVLCPEYKQQFVEAFDLDDATAEKIVPIYNTIDLAPNPSLDKKKEIVFVGRLDPVQKRVDRLLEVWSKVQQLLPDWQLKIYGNGRDLENLQRIAQRLKLDRVHFCGYTSDTGSVYQTASILCLTSTFEGWPMVMTEAINYGVVPFVFDCCAGMQGVLGTDNSCGVLVPPFDLEQYTEDLVELCRDEARLMRMRLAALERRKLFTREANNESWLKLLDDLS